jgi:predicted lipid-binding transport protein (Tim44 family)
MREDFEHWWNEEGQYSELCGKELCLIAWSNGEYKAQKELTDQEITKVFDECYPNNGDGDVVTLIDFAKAILKKARE